MNLAEIPVCWVCGAGETDDTIWDGRAWVTRVSPRPLIGHTRATLASDWLMSCSRPPRPQMALITAYFDNSLSPIMSYWLGFYPNFPRSSNLSPTPIGHLPHNVTMNAYLLDPHSEHYLWHLRPHQPHLPPWALNIWPGSPPGPSWPCPLALTMLLPRRLNFITVSLGLVSSWSVLASDWPALSILASDWLGGWAPRRVACQRAINWCLKPFIY